MKITHWIAGDISNGKKRKGSNQYRTKQKGIVKVKLIAIIIGCVLAVATIIYAYNAYQASPSIFKGVVKGNIPTISQTDPLTQEERANIQRQSALAEEYIILTKQKSKLDAEYKVSSAEIETKLEAIRKEKVSL
jgi:hypothetical protein